MIKRGGIKHVEYNWDLEDFKDDVAYERKLENELKTLERAGLKIKQTN